MNSGAIPASQTVKVTLPAAIATLPVQVSGAKASGVACDPLAGSCGWLQVTPDQGHAPLTLTVSVNPTGITPGNYPASFVVDTVPSSGKPVTVTVSLQVTNPPSQLSVTSTSANWTASSAANTPGALAFTYTTGDPVGALATSVLSVSSTGDIIPFNVTVANAKGGTGGTSSSAVWLRVSSTSATTGAATTTSGSAGVGSLFPIFVTIDYPTLQGLAIGQYFASITVTPATANAKLNVPQVVSVSLVVSAGAPTVTTVFPQSLTPAQPVDPTFTIYGANFTANTSLFLDVYITPDPTNPSGPPLPVSHQIQWSTMNLVSAKILQAKITAAFIPVAPAGINYPYQCDFRVQNGGFPAVTVTFWVTDPNAPAVTLVVNAASYQQASKFTGTLAIDPAIVNPGVNTAISPREVISIFGQNLGPTVVSTAWPVAAAGPTPSYYDTTWNGMRVLFTYTDPATNLLAQAWAPILMISVNQINAIVPQAVSAVLAPSATTIATVTVMNINTGQTSIPYPVTVIAEDPGIFTFGGVGQGQGAIINYDANGAATINASTNQEPRGNIVALFATGMGVLTNDSTIMDGALTSVTAPGIKLNDAANVKVFVGGQPAVVLYAGTSPGAVAGLVQVNVIIPPTSSTGAVPILLTIGDPTVTRQGQAGVTVAVKK
jgi:uncharacterized protein (TIGR03437 family)